MVSSIVANELIGVWNLKFSVISDRDTAVCWDVMPWVILGMCRRFKGTCCLSLWTVYAMTMRQLIPPKHQHWISRL